MTERFKLYVGNDYGVQTVDGKVIFDSIRSIADADVLVDLLNELHEEKSLLLRKNGRMEEENQSLKKKLEFFYELNKPYGTIIEENKRLKSQLYCDDEEGVCNICKHHYLVKDDEAELGYYNSRCKKGHNYECARVSLKHCEDFEKELE